MNDTKLPAFGIIADLVRSTSADKTDAYRRRILDTLVPAMIDTCNKYQTHDNGDHAADTFIRQLGCVNTELVELMDRTCTFEVHTDSANITPICVWLTTNYHDFEARQFNRGDLWTITLHATGHSIMNVSRMCKQHDATFSLRIE